MQLELLLSNLNYEATAISVAVARLKQLDSATLHWKSDELSWSILECIEHLNLYHRFYLPIIEEKINSSHYPSEAIVKKGILGNYFATSILPSDKMKKMKALKSMTPLSSTIDENVIDDFLQYQERLLALITQSARVNFNKIHIPTAFSKIIKTNLGDTYRFIINHMKRHLLQIETILTDCKKIIE